MSAPRHHPPALGLGLCYWDKARGKQHVHKAWTRRCTPLGHITLYNGCQGWHIQHQVLVRKSPTYTAAQHYCVVFYALPQKCRASPSACHCGQVAGSYRDKSTPKPPRNHLQPLHILYVGIVPPILRTPNLIPAEPNTSTPEGSQPNPFPAFSSSALTLLSNLAQPWIMH